MEDLAGGTVGGVRGLVDCAGRIGEPHRREFPEAGLIVGDPGNQAVAQARLVTENLAAGPGKTRPWPRSSPASRT